jgi:protein-tyrosine-phosphatase/DNA-binding transcriptional ArsR family regulator
MSTEVLAVEQRARVHAALGDTARLTIVDQLALGDVSPGDLGRLLDLPTNLVAHHLAVLQTAGLIVRRRSENDRRRSYVRLVPGILPHLLRPALLPATRVVFVCTHNSARSQLAAAALAARSPLPTASAGTEPAMRVHPRAVRVARRHGLDLSKAEPAHVDDIIRTGDLVVSVCDTANEHLHTPGRRLHWSVPDPARVDTDAAFQSAYADLSDRVDRLIPVLSGGTK